MRVLVLLGQGGVVGISIARTGWGIWVLVLLGQGGCWGISIAWTGWGMGVSISVS